jgi:hypothetical protein
LSDEKIICQLRRTLIEMKMPGLAPGIFIGIAFSSEAGAGWREENASNLKMQ